MPDVQLVPLAVSISVCVVLAVLGNVWVGDSLTTWYPKLVKPRLMVPLWTFIVVGILVYVIEGFVLYRLLVYVTSVEGKVVTLAALLVVMIYNEAWNYAFFGMRSMLAALVGIIAFLAPMTILMTALFAYEPVSGWMLLPYCFWVAYDVWWVDQLRRLNPGAPGESSE